MKNVLMAAIVAALGACATSSPDVVQRGDAQSLSQVQDGTVLSIRPVTVDGSQSGVGAVAGGVIVNAAERAGTRENAVEMLIQLRNGERRAIVQAVGGETIAPGDAVVLTTTGGRTRVTRAPQPLPLAPRS